ncbi:TOBE domain-containing protein [Aquimarina pacifica]|uniref:TOBE domain-containing protein n=1 Tax=Aquimarina pacifica TaxID=1296415 RepID=UPI00046F4CFB|nr:TOBE domain-containing protein [Aquimarina pacifica]
MNTLRGHISTIQTHGSLSLVQVCVHEDVFWTTIVIETPDTASYLCQGKEITLMFKETEVSISTDLDLNISIHNKAQGTILEIEKGILLSKLVLATNLGNITALLTSKAINLLQLKIGDPIVAMVKTTEIMVSHS